MISKRRPGAPFAIDQVDLSNSFGGEQPGKHVLTLVTRFSFSALVQSTEALVKCLLAGAGVGVTSFLAVQKHLDSGELEIIDVSGFDISRSFFIIQHRGRSLFSCSRMMMDRVKEYIRTLNTGEFGARS